MKRLLVTSALPYANGPLHLGHLLEFIQTDIYVRFRKLIGDDVLYVCASDAHGTPIEINATKQGITPQELVTKFHKQHKEDLDKFYIGLDNFYTTDSLVNRNHVERIFDKAQDKGYIVRRDIEQFYCETCQRFLPDRCIRGVCPKCGVEDQYGDVCEACGNVYEPTELLDAKCGECGSTPVIRTSKHYFFQLKLAEEVIVEWAGKAQLHKDTRLLIDSWRTKGLKDWDISRDSPYFGFEIPGETDKYFYVWVDAPVGYISATDHFLLENATSLDRYHQDLKDYWLNPHTDVELHHFIGKDIVYFHALFWPALLHVAGYRTPTAIHVHGFLTQDSHKLSKTRGTSTTITPSNFDLDPNYLRWYFASKLRNSLSDVDFDTKEFVTRVNAELVNNITNLVSRSISFLNKKLNSMLGVIPQDTRELQDEINRIVKHTTGAYRDLNFSVAVSYILAVSDIANNYMQQSAPWSMIKTDPKRARNDLTFVINCVKIVTVLLKPILPSFCEKVEHILGLGSLKWEDAVFDTQLRTVNQFEKLLDRLEL
jgi:methionyl-tRNA synthetase